MIKFYFFFAAILMSFLFANETERLQPIYESKNHEGYETIYNKHGAIFFNESNKIYLGKSCDVYSKKYGRGKWGQANGGFIVFFKKKSIVFPRQELIMRMKVECNL